ncbi:hypothetical protein OIV83_000861 [Microbotryomycetes sp. JL201]|nr:hypothetical protein OIV83_000861 [Microbotryomycetes sp. JL201]
MAARFPEEPSQGDRDAFKSFMYLFSRVYPCGECAAEFQELLKLYPPQVNERLGKDEFDCSQNLEGLYDCGCGGPDGTATTSELELSQKRGHVGTKPEGLPPRRGQDNYILDRQGRRIDPITGAKLVGG